MPAWTNSPSTPIGALLSGQVRYAAGSKATGPTTRMIIDHVSVATNMEGNIPVVGDLIYVFATTQNAGGLNTSTGIAISAVSITSSTGKGTVSYPKSTSNLSITADSGYAQSNIAEVAETLVSAQAYSAFAVNPAAGYGVTWSYTCPSAPAAIAIQLEGAIDNNDAEFSIIGSSQTTTSGYPEVIATLPELVRFVRIKVTSTSGGTNPTLIAKLIQS